MVPIWLERSGGQPLNIVVKPIFVRTFEETEHENHAVDAILCNHAHRWKDIKLIVTKPMVSFLKNIPENLPMLHTLYIDGPTSNLGISSLNNFKHAPSLRVLTLDKRVSRLSPQFMPKVPWAQLTKCTLLKGGNYTCQDGYGILSKAVRLQSFTMEIDATSTISPSTPSTGIRPAELLSLDLSVVRGAKTHDLLNLLTLPVLTELQVTGRTESNTPEYIAALITRSGCPLQRLSLGSLEVPFTHNKLHELFKIIPMLSELELQLHASTGVGNGLMGLLTHKPDHDAGLCCLLPHLKIIKLAVHSAFSYERFSAFLSSRRDVVACRERGIGIAELQEAVLVTWKDFNAGGRRAYHLPYKTYDQFMELSISGLDLYVHDGARLKCPLEDYFFPGEEEDDSDSEPEAEELEWNADDSDLYY
ncbi:hypothetical protein FIBSPDRAFT_874860 [Athelia psychrophila]|uniref:RNI-like protein n=1 Tax=Athelia psychrophila TaxID=1759441 RepID=A0A165X1T0_9AGAM|nr:hypothetical protein FIBSPDRAFT_874860 [Fibularhizoctonia sp. CBS 109695]